MVPRAQRSTPKEKKSITESRFLPSFHQRYSILPWKRIPKAKPTKATTSSNPASKSYARVGASLRSKNTVTAAIGPTTASAEENKYSPWSTFLLVGCLERLITSVACPASWRSSSARSCGWSSVTRRDQSAALSFFTLAPSPPLTGPAHLIIPETQPSDAEPADHRSTGSAESA